MGSIRFSKESIGVKVAYGRPENVQLPQGSLQYSREVPSLRKEGWDQVPESIARIYRAMQLAVPPEGAVLASAGQTGLKERQDAIFGSGQRGPTRYEWCPTSLIVGGARAWVRHCRWQEGGGNGWHGRPIYHDWAVAGVFLRDDDLRPWADNLFEHPLGRALESHGDYTPWLYFPAGTNPRAWPDVDILKEKFSFREDHYDVERITPPGVYRVHRVAWRLWEGLVFVHLPEYWQVTAGADWGGEVHYPFRLARNGREERRFAPPYSSLEADEAFWRSGRSPEGRLVEEYTTSLPDLPEYDPPAEAGGSYASFWESPEAWADFARRHNVRADRAFLSQIGPRDPGGVLVPLTRALAERAWSEGATMLPPGAHEFPRNFRDLPPFEEGYRADYPNRLRKVPGGPFGGLTVRIEEEDDQASCLIKDRPFWIEVPPGLALPFGHTVREVGDPTIPGLSETVVYRDGIVRLPEPLVP